VRRKIIAALAAVALIGAGAGTGASPLHVSAAAAKPCSSGYKHAVIGGAHKCLRRGQFCARSADRQYHRYGFHCHKYDSSVNRYRLT
jgi:hypothetical protein